MSLDGTIRPIKTLESFRGGAHPSVSPDGTSIAYSVFAPKGSSARQVFVIDADGRNERAVATLEGSNARQGVDAGQHSRRVRQYTLRTP